MDRRPKIDVELMSNAMWHGALEGNKPGLFVNKMVPPLKLEYGEWDVAVNSVQYEHSWRMKADYVVTVVFFYAKSATQKGDYTADILLQKEVTGDEKRNVFELPLENAGGMRIVTFPMETDETKRIWSADVIKIPISVGEDQGADYVGTEIANLANRFYRQKYNLDGRFMVFEFDKLKQRSRFMCENNETLISLEGENRAIARILGYDSNGVQKFADYTLIKVGTALEAELPPRLRSPSSLLIYSSIVTDQRCGDANVHLLAKVPVKSKFGDVVQYDFIKPNPKALKYGLKEINEIDIQIHDHAGHPIDFTGGLTNLSLIFTKAKEY